MSELLAQLILSCDRACATQMAGRWDICLLQVVEALLAAGYLPRTFTRTQVADMKSREVTKEDADALYDPLLHDSSLQLDGANRCGC